MGSITLPWPAKALHPNARVHWATKARAAKAARAYAGWATKASKVRVDGEGAITLKITFYPPDNRRRDLDGMFSSLKNGVDGIADSLGVNDFRFRYTLEIGEVVKGGYVLIEVSE